MRMRGEACHNGLAPLAKVVREASHFVALHAGVDEQHTSVALHHNGVALEELTHVDDHTLRDLRQHGWLLPLVVCNRSSRRSPVKRIALAVCDGSVIIARSPSGEWWGVVRI